MESRSSLPFSQKLCHWYLSSAGPCIPALFIEDPFWYYPCVCTNVFQTIISPQVSGTGVVCSSHFSCACYLSCRWLTTETHSKWQSNIGTGQRLISWTAVAARAQCQWYVSPHMDRTINIYTSEKLGNSLLFIQPQFNWNWWSSIWICGRWMDPKGGTVNFLFSTLLYHIFLLKENILKNLTIGIWLFCLITVLS